MAIVNTDIKYCLSGGWSNPSPSASLGGGRSSTEADNGIFDNGSSAEAVAGDVEYRCVYVLNDHGSLTLLGAKLWVQTNTPSADTNVEIGLGTSAVNGTEQTISDENTAPTGVSFSAPSSEGAGLTIGDLGSGQHKAIWIKRTVTAGAAATNDSFVLRVKGDTNP